ncbi:MAG: hypothetical protein PHV34_20615 [Verrucomicrobiae bacterium]|nr:hypothetical protein [Verrucomicrobiae bacterium]
MEEWQPSNAQALDFEFNLSTEREFCEVFGMELSMARRLVDYRTSNIHIFQLEDILKVEGISSELLQQWTAPAPEPQADPSLLQGLGLAGTAPSIPDLLASLCAATGDGSAFLTNRNGEILLQQGDSGEQYQAVIPQIPAMVESWQTDLMQMNIGSASCQTLQFAQSNLSFLPAGAFFLIGLQPGQPIAPGKLALWISAAREIRRRLPPRLFIENHAEQTTTDIAFDCPSCQLRILVDSSAIGYTFPCPRCKAPATVPESSTSNGSYYESTEAPPSTAPAEPSAPPA